MSTIKRELIKRELIKDLKKVQQLRFCNCCGTGIKPNDKFCRKCGANLEYKDIGNVVFECENCGAIFRHRPPKKHMCWVCGKKMKIKIKILEV